MAAQTIPNYPTMNPPKTPKIPNRTHKFNINHATSNSQSSTATLTQPTSTSQTSPSRDPPIPRHSELDPVDLHARIPSSTPVSALPGTLPKPNLNLVNTAHRGVDNPLGPTSSLNSQTYHPASLHNNADLHFLNNTHLHDNLSIKKQASHNKSSITVSTTSTTSQSNHQIHYQNFNNNTSNNSSCQTSPKFYNHDSSLNSTSDLINIMHTPTHVNHASHPSSSSHQFQSNQVQQTPVQSAPQTQTASRSKNPISSNSAFSSNFSIITNNPITKLIKNQKLSDSTSYATLNPEKFSPDESISNHNLEHNHNYSANTFEIGNSTGYASNNNHIPENFQISVNQKQQHQTPTQNSVQQTTHNNPNNSSTNNTNPSTAAPNSSSASNLLDLTTDVIRNKFGTVVGHIGNQLASATKGKMNMSNNLNYINENAVNNPLQHEIVNSSSLQRRNNYEKFGNANEQSRESIDLGFEIWFSESWISERLDP